LQEKCKEILNLKIPSDLSKNGFKISHKTSN
jgi:hypothetical protein